MKKMRASVRCVAVLLAVLATAVVPFAMNTNIASAHSSKQANHASSRAKQDVLREFHLRENFSHFKTSGDPTKEGYTQLFYDDVYSSSGTLVGIDNGTCVQTNADPALQAYECVSTITFASGSSNNPNTITIIGEIDNTQKASTYDIVGGTGAFDGVSGKIVETSIDNNNDDLHVYVYVPLCLLGVVCV